MASQFGAAPQPFQAVCMSSFGYANDTYLLESRLLSYLS